MTTSIGKILIAATVAVALAGCSNDGAGPQPGDTRSVNNQSAGTGAGNSATGATGGTATSPGAGNAATTPGTSQNTGGGTDTTGAPK